MEIFLSNQAVSRIFVWMTMMLFLLVSVWTAKSQAQEKALPNLQTLQILFENDLFGDTDKYYTNAVQATWLSGDLKQYKDDVRLPEWTFPIIRTIPFSQRKDSIHNVGILFGQHIYTPADIQEYDLIENDRPYAGYLYAGLALHSKTDTILDTMEVTIGIVGPEAFAEFSQNTVHELRNIATAKGWDNQLHNEPTLQLSWQRKWRFYQGRIHTVIDHDLIGHAGLTVGNVRVAVNTGFEFRLGYRIPKDFGSDVIRTGAGVSTPALKASTDGKKPFGMHLFAGAQIEGVAHDIFLDGNTFESSPSVDKEKKVATLSGGLALNFGRYKFTYRHIYRTRQFTHQKQDQIIGSLTLTVSF